jgi:hypothetical protein
MNHDLFLRRPPISTPLTFAEVQEAVRGDPGLSPLVNEEHTTPERLVLADGDTGAVVFVAPGGPPEGLFSDEVPEEAEDELGAEPPLAAPLDHLHVQLPYLWPKPFAEDGARMALALASLLGWNLEDPADPATRPEARDVAAVVRSWEEGRRELLAELAGDPEAGEVRRVPAELLAGIHGSNRARREAKGLAPAGVEVPRLVLVEFADDRTAGALCRYTAGEPVWLPDAATHVLLVRKKRGFLGYREEQVVVRAEELRALLGPAERSGEAPEGRRAYRPTWPDTDKIWGTLAGRPPKETNVIGWAGVVETGA